MRGLTGILIALASLFSVTIPASKACAQVTGTESWTLSEHAQYVKALEDSLIVLQALRPAYSQLKTLNTAINEKHEADRVHERKVCEATVQAVKNQAEAKRKRSAGKGLLFAAGGAIIGIILGSL